MVLEALAGRQQTSKITVFVLESNNVENIHCEKNDRTKFRERGARERMTTPPFARSSRPGFRAAMFYFFEQLSFASPMTD